ncbi:MAG TPA: ABC transporter permease [Silvibacterium sp.]|nr:ABC transporter permease [Silvibacterium sp.]
MRSLLQDGIFAIRQLRRHRAYALVTIVSMALGVGAAAAVYSVLYGVLIDPYPYRDAAHIAFITVRSAKSDDAGDRRLTVRQVEQLKQLPAVEDAFAQGDASMVATDGELPVSVKVLQMTGNGLDFLGAPMLLGRAFNAAEAPVGKEPSPVAVISYPFWKTHFNSRTDVLGKNLELDHRKYTVIGVAPPRFTWHDSEVYLPMPASIDPEARFQTLIRVRKGVSMEAASSQMQGFVEQDNREHPKMFRPDQIRVKVESLNDWLLGRFKGTLMLLFCASGVLLLIGCGNVSILMLARGRARVQELAMRTALGATRLRILRQLLTEAVVLSLAGGALGVALAYLGIRLITALMPEYAIPHEVVIAINLPVLAFSVVVSIACGLVFGTVPGLQLSRPGAGHLVPSAGTRTATTRRSPLQVIMLAGQVALSVVLLAAGAAAMRHYVEAYTANLGFNPHPVLTLTAQLPEGSYPAWQARVSYYDQMLEKVSSLPGVASATFSSSYPENAEWTTDVTVQGRTANSGRESELQMISPGYFATLGIPQVSGRIFTRAEVLRGAPLVVVNRAFVRKYFDGSDPIGRNLIIPDLDSSWPNIVKPTSTGQPLEIVGVVEDSKNYGLHRPVRPQVYVPFTLFLPWGQLVFVRASSGNPAALERPVAAVLMALNQDQAIQRPMPMDDFMSMFSWSHERFTSVIFVLFAVVALALAMIGLFSVVAYGVEQRTREIGIRVALGAHRWDVLTLALSSSLQATGAGLAAGILATLLLNNTIYRWTDSTTRDAAVLFIVSGVFLLTTLLACLWPANRALHVDPLEALRAE